MGIIEFWRRMFYSGEVRVNLRVPIENLKRMMRN